MPAFLAATRESRLGPLYAVAVGTGMRQGELLGLRWSDVDLENGKLAVRHTLRRGIRGLAEPKTHHGRRVLHLGREVTSVLRAQRIRQAAERLAGWPSLERWRLRLRDAYGAAVGRGERHARVPEGAGIRRPSRQRFHDLRHAYATLMVEDGEELSVVSRSLGHADLSTTADIYAHLTPKIRQPSAERVDAILTGRATG